MTKREQKERDEAIAVLLTSYGIRPGDRVYTGVSNVARSGMSRHIHVYVVTWNRQISTISGLVAKAIGHRRSMQSGGIVMGGCGMDLGFQVVYLLGRSLWPNGGPVKDSVRRHQEERDGNKRESNGGYLLKHEAL